MTRDAARRETIAELRGEKGWSYARIARRLGCSKATVSWYCLIDGVEKPGVPPKLSRFSGPLTVRRGSHVVRRFSAAEDARLLELEASGLKLGEIGRRLGRRRNTILARLATLARHDERAMSGTEGLRG